MGIQTSAGVILAAEKRLTSSLLEQSRLVACQLAVYLLLTQGSALRSIEKVYEIDSHVGAAISGLTADARTLVDRLRIEAQNHTFVYAEPMKPESLMQSLSDIMISFGEGKDDDRKVKMGRPFGVSLLTGGVESGKPVLYCIDPSGTYVKYKAHAIGNGGEAARSMLQERYDVTMGLEDAKVSTVRVLVEGMEDKVSKDNCEVVTITPEGGFQILGGDEIEALIAQAKEQKAKEDA